MKWPQQVILIRHGESEFNRMKREKNRDPEYRQFVELFEKELVAEKFDQWPDVEISQELKDLANKVYRRYRFRYTNRLTPLTEHGWEQAEQTGRVLASLPDIELPDIILVSPLLRARQTLDGIIRGWPEVAGIEQEFEPLVREIETGAADLYNDWRMLETFHLEQRYLYLRQGKYDYCYPQGENIPRVEERMRLLSGKLVREFSGKKVWIVSHHVTITAFISIQKRWTDKEFMEFDERSPIDNCSCTIFAGDPAQGESGEGKLVLQTYITLPK